MAVKQISIVVDNTPGKLSKLTALLAENKIDMRALSLADSADYGILRILASHSEELIVTLYDAGYIAKINPVIAVSVDDTPGGLSKVVAILGENGVNIEYLYAFVLASTKDACVVIRADDNEKAEKLLSENGVKLLTERDIDAI